MIAIKKNPVMNAFIDVPLTWRRVLLDGKATAGMTCSNGHYGLIDEHEIAADGTVTPSVVCRHEGCAFHELIRLEEWTP